MSLEYMQSCGPYQLLFGLRWFPILGASATHQARALCKTQRAKSWVVSGRHFSTVGISQTGLKAKQISISAAVCFADLFPRGVQAAIYELGEKRFWLIAAHDGTPLRHGDAVFATLEQARQRARQLAVHHTTLVLHPEVQSIQEFLPLLTQRLRVKAQMQPVRQRRWAIVAALMGVLSLAYWSYMPRVSVAAVEPEVLIDPYQQHWEQQAKPASHQMALQALIEHWHQLPLELAAWRLSQSDCQIKSSYWECLHSFKAILESATAVDFQKHQDPAWQLVQAELQAIQVQVHIPFETEARQWQSAQALQATLLSQLQAIRPAFQHVKLNEPLPYLSRNTMSSGSGYSPIFEQSFVLQAPLRSLSLLLDFGDLFYWERAALTINHRAKVSLKQSALQTQLYGVAYARD